MHKHAILSLVRNVTEKICLKMLPPLPFFVLHYGAAAALSFVNCFHCIYVVDIPVLNEQNIQFEPLQLGNNVPTRLLRRHTVLRVCCRRWILRGAYHHTTIFLHMAHQVNLIIVRQCTSHFFSDSRFDCILNANKGLQNSPVPPVDNLGPLVLPRIQVRLLCSHRHLNDPNMEVKHSRF